MIEDDIDADQMIELVTDDVVADLQSYKFNILTFAEKVGRKN
jgi:hypothetical protein